MPFKSFCKNLMNAFIRWLRALSRPSKETNLDLLRHRGETLAAFTIRTATRHDVPKIAALHVATWNETYYGSNSPTYHIREYQWRQLFEQEDGSWFVLVIEKPDGELVGFARGARYMHADLPAYKGELNKMYLLREYQRLGLGRRLMAQVAFQFKAMGINNMVLFGMPQNPSCRFYEVMGGRRLYARNGEFHGGYGFSDLSKIIAYGC